MFSDIIERLNNVEKLILYSGSFDGVVVDNKDPDNRYRIKAEIKMIFGEHETVWATPVLVNTGLLFLPDIGDKVKIMFQGSNPMKPEYIGVFYDDKEIPFGKEEDIQKVRKIKTKKHEVIFDDDKNKVTIKSSIISLGGEEKESAVLGDTLAQLLKDILSWMKTHSHPIASPSVQSPAIIPLEQKVDKILSTKIKVD